MAAVGELWVKSDFLGVQMRQGGQVLSDGAWLRRLGRTTVKLVNHRCVVTLIKSRFKQLNSEGVAIFLIKLVQNALLRVVAREFVQLGFLFEFLGDWVVDCLCVGIQENLKDPITPEPGHEDPLDLVI